MVTVDQLNPSGLQSAELVVRRMQVIREAHRICPSAPDYSSADVFMGWRYRRQNQGVDSGLAAYVAMEFKNDAAIAKESRKAREEQQQRHQNPSKKGGEAEMPSEVESPGHLAAGSTGLSTAAALLNGAGPSFDFPGGVSSSEGQDRWRELFPLPISAPPSSRPGASICSRRRLTKVWKLVSEANDIVGCLNEMYHPAKKGFEDLKTSQAQSCSQHSIYKQLQRRTPVRQPCTEREAVKELLPRGVVQW